MHFTLNKKMDLLRINPRILEKYNTDSLPSNEKIISKRARRKKNTRRKASKTNRNKANGTLLKELTIPYIGSLDSSEELCIIRMYYKNTRSLHPENSLTGIYHEILDGLSDDSPWKSRLKPVYFNPGLNGTHWYDLTIDEKKDLLLSNEYIQNTLKEIELYNVKTLSVESPKTISFNETIPIDIQYATVNGKDYAIKVRAVTFSYPLNTKCYLEAEATTPEKQDLSYKSYEDISLVIHNDEKYRNTKEKFEEVHALIKEPYNLDVLAEELIKKITGQLEEQSENASTLRFFR